VSTFVTCHPYRAKCYPDRQYTSQVANPDFALARRQIYAACERSGRIAYKRSGGSRLITHNDHWKSQIRHALYTSDRFVR